MSLPNVRVNSSVLFTASLLSVWLLGAVLDAQTKTAQTKTAQTKTAQTKTAQTKMAQTKMAQSKTAQSKTAPAVKAAAADELALPLTIVRNSATGIIDIKRQGMMSVLTWGDKTSVRLVARNVDPQLGQDALFKLEVNSIETLFVFDAASKTLSLNLKKDQLPNGANTLRVTFIDKDNKKAVSSPTLAWMVH